jgi:cytosine/adenosine deaminase-related metal-dependent hydrolase
MLNETDVDSSRLRTLLARYVFPAAGPPLADGTVSIERDRIVAVGARWREGPVEDLGNVAILPGLVNAHLHLDLSDVPVPLGRRGIRFVDWIGLVMAHRLQHARTEQDAAPSRGVVEAGLQECVRSGTTALGDVAQPGWPAAGFASAPLAGTVFLELIGPTGPRVEAALELARRHLLAANAAAHWQPGLSPHAPYSVHPDLLAGAVALSAAGQAPLAFHLAESREEMELLHSGGGPLREMLDALGAWEPGAIRPGTRPLEFLRLLSGAHRALVIHGNYLDDREIELLARHARRMAVVYCPRTHAWFDHPPYPLEKMLAAGAEVALGTDSRASSPDLSLLAEMRVAAARHPAVSPEVVLQLGTLRAAAALGRRQEMGSLEPGKLANLAVVALPERTAADPYELLFDSDLPVVKTYYRGLPA